MGKFHGLELCWIIPSSNIFSLCLVTSSLCIQGRWYDLKCIALWGFILRVGIACSIVGVHVNLSWANEIYHWTLRINLR
jgi:hypothetical protein